MKRTPKSGTPEYRCWRAMINRCSNQKQYGYRWYGARGIIVCDRWLGSFDSFIADMGQKPSSDHSIDRIDSNGNYEPGNCRWADVKTQIKNRKNSRFVVINGVEYWLPDAVRENGSDYNKVQNRMRRGVPIEVAVQRELPDEFKRKLLTEPEKRRRQLESKRKYAKRVYDMSSAGNYQKRDKVVPKRNFVSEQRKSIKGLVDYFASFKV